MQKTIHFDRTVLRWIAKSASDTHPTTLPEANTLPAGQGYAVAMVRPEDDLSDLDAAIREVMPGARVARVAAPEGGGEDERALRFLNRLLEIAGEPAAAGAEAERIEPLLPQLLYPRVDFLVVDHAERLPADSLHALRRYHSMPPTILISYDTDLLATLSRDLLLMRNVYFFQSEAGPAY